MLSSGQGSSPLARGLQRAQVGGGGVERIIPARAGFTQGTGQSSQPSPDHPRSRGVYESLHYGHDSTVGSSPLARGLLFILSNAVLMLGIIPARAGFT